MNKLDNLNRWKIFLSLANTRNFQVTADYFESDLSTITRNLDTLEKALGQKLVFRKTRPLELTEFGKKAQQLMSPHLRKHQQIISELVSVNYLFEGEIRVSVAQGLSLYMVKLITEFRKYHPKVVFKLAGHGSIADIENNLADIACVTGKISSPEIFLIPRGKVTYASIAAPSYIKRNPVSNDPAQLKEHTIYQYDGENRTSPCALIRGEERFLISGENVLLSADILTIKKAVLDGAGLCLDMPLPLCKAELKKGELVKILPDWHVGEQPTFIAIHQNLLTSRKHRTFAYWLRDKLVEIDC